MFTDSPGEHHNELSASVPTRSARPADAARQAAGVWIYLAILGTVYVVVSLTLGVAGYSATQSNARKIEQLQTDTNDNLCNQQAYQGGTTCVGGDANGGSILP